MRYTSESGWVSIFAASLVTILALSFTAQPVFAQPLTTEQVSSTTASTRFMANATAITNGSVSYNFLGLYGNDTFDLFGGNTSGTFVATELLNGTFNVITGNPGTGANSSMFNLVGGASSNFDIIQNNLNGTVSLAIVGGTDSNVNATSIGPVSSTVLSINLGANSTADISSQFTGNHTTINIAM